MSVTAAQVRAALDVLAELDHHDRSRRLARELAAEAIPIVDIIRAGDGCTTLARALNVERRVSTSAREQAHAEQHRSLYQ